jgi:hypothetical protein
MRFGGPQGRSGRVQKIYTPPELDVGPSIRSELLYRLSYPGQFLSNEVCTETKTTTTRNAWIRKAGFVRCVRFEVLAAVLIKIIVFLDAVPG